MWCKAKSCRSSLSPVYLRRNSGKGSNAPAHFLRDLSWKLHAAGASCNPNWKLVRGVPERSWNRPTKTILRWLTIWCMVKLKKMGNKHALFVKKSFKISELSYFIYIALVSKMHRCFFLYSVKKYVCVFQCEFEFFNSVSFSISALKGPIQQN